MRVTGMERSLRLRKLAKPMAFLAIIALLLVLSKFTVSYSPSKGAVALSPDARDRVVVTSMNGGTMLVPDSGADSDGTPQLVGVDTWSPSSNIIMVSPHVSATGCGSLYQTSMDITFSTANRLSVEQKGAVNVTVIDFNRNLTLATSIVTLDFKPGQETSGSANFNIQGTDPDPVYMVTVTFPTSADLSSGVPGERVSLIEYLLYQTGILSP
jgi:hypothetical protein